MKISSNLKFSLFRSRPKTSICRDEVPDPIGEDPVGFINPYVERDQRRMKPVTEGRHRFMASEPSAKFTPVFDRSEVEPKFGAYKLGEVPEYIKQARSRVAANKVELDKDIAWNKQVLNQRRPKTARPSTRLERILELPEPIGDSAELERYHKQIASLKNYVVTTIDVLKVTCDDTKKNLLDDIQDITTKIDDQLVGESSKDKIREADNLKMKNDALNTSLLHKAVENAKLKRELSELKKDSRAATPTDL